MAHPELLAKIAHAQPNPSTTLDSAIHRYLNGESMQVLAKELSISRATIYNWMLRKSGPEHWAELRQQAMIQRIAIADEKLEEATAAMRTAVQANEPVTASRVELARLDIAQAREQARFARMDYERLCKDYAPKQEVERHDHITVVLNPQCDVTPYIDVKPSIIPSDSEVIDSTKEDDA